MIYLATPYTDILPHVMQERAQRARRIAYHLACRGVMVYCPIAYGCALEPTQSDIPHSYWIDHGIEMLSHCHMLMVVRMPGWANSKGIKQEIKYAKAAGIPVVYADNDEFPE